MLFAAHENFHIREGWLCKGEGWLSFARKRSKNLLTPSRLNAQLVHKLNEATNATSR